MKPVLLVVMVVACTQPAVRAARDLRGELLTLHQARVKCGDDWDCVGAADERNVHELERIIAEVGWPGVALAGVDGAEAAFMVVSHAPRAMLEFQVKCLPLLEQAAAKGDVPRANFATLTDRVLIRQGKPQRYGSQFHVTDAGVEPFAIEDEPNLEARRQQLGLMPFEEYAARLRGPRPGDAPRPDAG